MSNYGLQWAGGVPHKSKLPSAKIEVIDVYLTKVPNWSDGSDHTTAGQVILRGEGLYVVHKFRADDAQVTITSGKTFTTNSGSTTTLNGAGTIGAEFVVSGSGQIAFESGTDLIVRAGATATIQGAFEDPGLLVMNEHATMNAEDGSFINVYGTFNYESTAVANLLAGGAFNVYGSGFVIKPGATVSVTGTGGSPSEVAWGANTEASFGDGAELNLNKGSSMTISSSTAVLHEGTETRSNYTVMIGADAYVGLRVANMSNTTGTLNAWENDLWHLEDALAADIVKTLAVPPGSRKVRTIIRRTATAGADTFKCTLKNHDGAAIDASDAELVHATLGTQFGHFELMFDGTNWIVLNKYGVLAA